MENYGKMAALNIGVRIERKIHNCIMGKAKNRYSIDSNKAMDDLPSSIRHVFDNDISNWGIDAPRRLKGFFPKNIIASNINNIFVRDDEPLNSWETGDLLVKYSLDNHYTIRCLVDDMGCLMTEDAVVLITYRPSPESAFLNDIYCDPDTGLSKLKVYERSEWATGGYGMVDTIKYRVDVNPDRVVLLDFV